MRINATKPGTIFSRKPHLWLLLPSLGFIGLLAFIPVGYATWISLFAVHALRPVYEFVGLRNFVDALKDPEYWFSLRNTVVFTASTLAAQFILGLGTALLLNMPLKGRAVFRGVILFPYVMILSVSVFLWKWILNDSYGLLNYILLSLNIIENPIMWLGRNHIMVSLVLVSTWVFFPFAVVSFLGALQEVDPALYEAARADGASAIQRFWFITLPHLRNVMVVVLLLRGMWMFTKFDVVWLMAGETSLGRYTKTLPVYAYELAFRRLQLGQGSSVSVLSFTILMILVSTVLVKMYQTEAMI